MSTATVLSRSSENSQTQNHIEKYDLFITETFKIQNNIRAIFSIKHIYYFILFFSYELRVCLEHISFLTVVEKYFFSVKTPFY